MDTTLKVTSLPHLKVTGVRVYLPHFSHVLVLVVFWKKRNTSCPPQSPTRNCHLPREKLKPLIRLPTKALWTDILPHRHSSDLISYSGLYCRALSIRSYVVFSCTFACAVHLAYVLSSQRHPTACCLHFLLSPFRIHFINLVFSNYFCLPPPHTLCSLALLLSRPITTPTFIFTLVSLPTFEHQLHGISHYYAYHYV